MDEQRDESAAEPDVPPPQAKAEQPQAGAPTHSGPSAYSAPPPVQPGTQPPGTFGPPTQPAPQDPAGPPTPPTVRARRRRWLIVGLCVVVAFVLAVPIVLALGGFPSQVATVLADDPVDEDDPDAGTTLPELDDPDEGGADGDPDSGTSDSGGFDQDVPAPTPDIDALEGADAVFAELLGSVDEAELVMIGFQSEVADALATAGPDDLEDLNARLSDVAADRRVELIEVRDALDQATDDADAEAVRQAYLDHVDSWGEYMTAVESNPETLFGEGGDGGYTVVINATADAFVRALEEQLPDNIDDEVADLARHILQRGFSGSAEAQV